MTKNKVLKKFVTFSCKNTIIELLFYFILKQRNLNTKDKKITNLCFTTLSTLKIK